jgi:hypothetical protein
MKNKFFEDKEKILEYQYNIFNFLGYDLDHLIENRKYIDCPDQDCSGKKAGFFLSREYDYYCKCNKCEKTFDVIDFFKEVKDLKDLKKGEVLPILFKFIEDNNIPKDSVEKIKSDIVPAEEEEKESIKNLKDGNYLDYYFSCRENLKQDFSYMKKRGFVEEEKEQIYKLGIGLDQNDNSIIFPITSGSYIKRYIKPIKKKEDEKEIRYRNSRKINKEDHFCFNLNKLENYNKNIVFISEGIMDALTLQILNKEFLCIASGGANAKTKVLEKFEDVMKKNDKKMIVLLAFDNDTAGDLGTNNFKKDLEEIKNIKVFDVREKLINKNIFSEKAKAERRKKIYGTCVQDDFYFIENNGEKIEDHNRFCYKDINEKLQKDRENLIKDLEEVKKFGEEMLKIFSTPNKKEIEY